MEFMYENSINTQIRSLVSVYEIKFNLVTGLKIHWVTTIVCTVCIFYTSVVSPSDKRSSFNKLKHFKFMECGMFRLFYTK